MSGVGSDGKAFLFTGAGQGSIPGASLPNGGAVVGGFQFSYGSFYLSATGLGSPAGPLFEASVRGQITFMPLNQPTGGDPRNITSVLSFTSPPGLVLWSAIGENRPATQLGFLTFSLSGATLITGSNSGVLNMVTSGTGGTATLDLAAAVPEPSTWLLPGAGLTGVAWKMQRGTTQEEPQPEDNE